MNADLAWRNRTIAFIGAGELAEALIAGMVGKGFIPPHQIRVTNRSNKERLRRLAEQFGVETSSDPGTILRGADVAIVAVKPADAAKALSESAAGLDADTILISVMAGISLDYLYVQTGGHRRLIRAMPNTAARVGQAATALCAHPTCDGPALDLAMDLFGRVGSAVIVPEALFNAVTAVSGSGPAYVYFLVEAMLRAAGDLGMPPETAHRLVVQTVVGAGAMMMTTGLPPDVLRHQVTSPAGTTAAALAVLKEAGFSDSVYAAVQRAAQRAAELAQH